MPGAEVAVAHPGQNRGADIGVVPDLLPSLGNFVGRFPVQDVGLLHVVDSHIGNVAAFLVQDFHLFPLPPKDCPEYTPLAST